MNRRSFLTTLAAVQALPVAAKPAIRVTAWSERTEPVEIYPDGINGTLVKMFEGEKGIVARAANLADPGQGLTEEALRDTDVLIAFGHRQHKVVTGENVDRILRRVEMEGMGYLPIHSSHYALAFQKIMTILAGRRGSPLEGIPGKWGKVRNEGKPELIHVLEPTHPIARGVKDFIIPKTESYLNPFNVPPPDLKILEGRYEGGPQDGSDGMLWNFGKGKVFYFRPGHETYPIYSQPEVQQVLKNAVRFLAAR
ncbi:MAG TPA: ThuA domain-containing protein [Bryobacteraceae bacterium]|jgi:trehalose utilization protein|nr:ThuA domain-containing protein [Bryobacteraceae bacterium]